MTYAFSLFNGVMLLGQNRLGASAGFKGNGMCFATRGLRRMPWRSYGLVEDMEYSWTLRIMGEKIAFEPEVAVHGAMLGSGGAAAANQRRRWEFGRGEIRKKYLGPLLRSDQISWWEKALSACELTIPPMAGLALIYVIVLALDVVACFALRSSVPPAVRGFLLASCTFMTASIGAYAISPFVVMRLPWRYAWSIALFPVYLIWKLLISLKGRPRQWVRTARESPREGPLTITWTRNRHQRNLAKSTPDGSSWAGTPLPTPATDLPMAVEFGVIFQSDRDRRGRLGRAGIAGARSATPSSGSERLAEQMSL